MPTLAIPDPQTTPVLTIPEAGRLLGIGRASAYRAADEGSLPTIPMGGRRRLVPTAALRRMLQVDAGAA